MPFLRAYSWRRYSRLLRLRRFLLLRAGAAQHTGHRVVAFVACVLVDLVVRARHRNGCGPRPRPRRRIVDRELVGESVRVGARETLREMEVLVHGRSQKYRTG